MGRTLRTMTNLVLEEIERWMPFRRALRREDQEVLDELFEAARHHSAEAAYASHPVPFETMLVCMLLETLKRVRSLERRLDSLERNRGRADHRVDP
ncbi:MAG: hypothetical protein QN189_05695 [Armatimonadota bacterium]|nr:hypothetical protein [Armatimonadota bacterium]